MRKIGRIISEILLALVFMPTISLATSSAFSNNPSW